MKYIAPLAQKKTIGTIALCGIIGTFFLHFFLSLTAITTIGLLCFIAIITLFLHNPAYGFLTLIIARTSVDFLSAHFSISLTDNIHLNIASLFAFLLIAMTGIFFMRHRADMWRNPLFIPFVVFILFSGFSAVYSIDIPATVSETLRVVSIFAVCGMAYALCTHYTDIQKSLTTVILLSAVIPGSFALYQLLTHTGFSDNLGTDGRLHATFTHPNSFAAFLMIIIAILTYRMMIAHESATRNTRLALVLLTTTFLVLTFSRGGWIACMIFFSILALLRAPRYMLFIAVATVALFFTSQTVHDRIEDIYNPPADSSIRWRIQQWHDAINAWKLSPIVGFGAGTEQAIHEQQQGFYAGNPYTHNDIIKALQETGIIGCIAFCALFITTIVSLVATYRNAREDHKLFVLVILLLFVAEIGFSMSSNIWRGTAVQWILWTLIAVALSHNPKKIC